MASTLYDHAEVAFRKSLSEVHASTAPAAQFTAFNWEWAPNTFSLPIAGRPRYPKENVILQSPQGFRNIHGHCYLIAASTMLLSLSKFVDFALRHSCSSSDECITCAFSKFANVYHNPSRTAVEVQQSARYFLESCELLFWGPRASKRPCLLINIYKPGGPGEVFINLFLHHVRGSVAHDPIQLQRFNMLFCTEKHQVSRCSACPYESVHGAYRYITPSVGDLPDSAALIELITNKNFQTPYAAQACPSCKKTDGVTVSFQLANLPEYLLVKLWPDTNTDPPSTGCLGGNLTLNFAEPAATYTLQSVYTTTKSHATSLMRQPDGTIHWVNNDQSQALAENWRQVEDLRVASNKKTEECDRMGRPVFCVYERSRTDPDDSDTQQDHASLSAEVPQSQMGHAIEEPGLGWKIKMLSSQFDLPEDELAQLLHHYNGSVQTTVDVLAFGSRGDMTLDDVPAGYQEDALRLKHKFERHVVDAILEERSGAKVDFSFTETVGAHAQFATHLSLRTETTAENSIRSVPGPSHIVDGSMKYYLDGREYYGHFTSFLRPTKPAEASQSANVQMNPGRGDWLQVADNCKSATTVQRGMLHLHHDPQFWAQYRMNAHEALNLNLAQKLANWGADSQRDSAFGEAAAERSWKASQISTVLRNKQPADCHPPTTTNKRKVDEPEALEVASSVCKRRILKLEGDDTPRMSRLVDGQGVNAKYSRSKTKKSLIDLVPTTLDNEEDEVPVQIIASTPKHVSPHLYQEYRRQQALFWLPCPAIEDIDPCWTSALMRTKALLLAAQRSQPAPSIDPCRSALMAVSLTLNEVAAFKGVGEILRFQCWLRVCCEEDRDSITPRGELAEVYQLHFADRLPNTRNFVRPMRRIFPGVACVSTSDMPQVMLEGLKIRKITDGDISTPPSPWPGADLAANASRENFAASELAPRMRVSARGRSTVPCHMDLKTKHPMCVAVAAFLKSLKEKRKPRQTQLDVDDLADCFSRLFYSTDAEAAATQKINRPKTLKNYWPPWTQANRQKLKRKQDQLFAIDPDNIAAAWALFEVATLEVAHKQGLDLSLYSKP